jgi:hypothetical protein
MEAMARREASIRLARYSKSFYPDSGNSGMLPISHVEHLARLAQIIADDAVVLADLRRQFHLIDTAIASVERLRNRRRPQKTKSAGAALQVPWHVADAIGRLKDITGAPAPCIPFGNN